jgi:hypothetical protein
MLSGGESRDVTVSGHIRGWVNLSEDVDGHTVRISEPPGTKSIVDKK